MNASEHPPQSPGEGATESREPGQASGQIITGGQRNVQINDAAGAQITVDFGGPPRKVPLERAVVPPGPGAAPSRLLRARAGILGLVDRGGLLAELKGWLGTGPGFACRLIAGRGGTGKTRLGVELCEHARSDGWLAGVLRPDFDLAQVEALADTRLPRLVVVDYAETRVPQLNALLPALRIAASPEYPVRVLLLSRGPAPGTQSAQVVARLRSSASDALEVILDGTKVVLLDDSPLTREEQAEVFTMHAQTFAARAAGEGQTSSAPVAVPGFVARGGEPNPLFLSIAAYLAVHGQGQVPASHRDLLAELERHEAHYWRRHADAANLDIDEVTRARVVALSTLAGADSEEEGRELLRLLPDLTDAPAERRGRVARWASNVYQGPRWWNTAEPDLFAEHLVAEHLTEADTLKGVLTRDDPASLLQPLRLLAMTATDFPDTVDRIKEALDARLVSLTGIAVREAAGMTPATILGRQTNVTASLTALVEATTLPPDTLIEAHELLPDWPDLLLSPLGVALCRAAVRGYRMLSEANPAAYNLHLAVSLNNYSNRLAEVGRRQEALAPADEAVELYRGLAETNQTVYTPGLAMSIGNYATRLSGVGRPAEALAMAEEAVTLRRALVEANPAAYTPDLAGSLNNYATCLSEMGLPRESLDPAREAVGLYRGLAKANPATYTPNLALSLSNYTNRLSEVMRWEEALATARQAVELYRGLAKANPATYTPDLARSLSNYANRLSEVGRWDDALAAAREALGLRQVLAEANPVAFTPDLAESLINYPDVLSRVGRWQEALAAAEEAVNLCRALTEANAAAYTHYLAASLNNYASQLARMDRHEEALVPAKEAVELYRRLPEANQAAHSPNLARSFNNYAALLSRMGQESDADAIRQELARTVGSDDS